MKSERVFELASQTRLSAYDCEFVALAEALSVTLVTADKAVLKAHYDEEAEKVFKPIRSFFTKQGIKAN